MPNNSINITRREKEAIRSSCAAVRANIMGRFISGALLVAIVTVLIVIGEFITKLP